MEHYTRCIDLSREHGFGRTEVAHLGQRGWSRVYTGDWQGAKEEVTATLEFASKVADRRAEMNARLCLCAIGFDLGGYDLIEANVERVLELARMLGARAWEPPALVSKALLLKNKGRLREAHESLVQAAEITRKMGQAFNAGRVFGALAWVMAEDTDVRQAALDEGEAALKKSSLSHNYFLFYRFAMDASLRIGDWEAVEGYAAALEDYTRDEPLWPADFFIARGRALAQFSRGARDDETHKELQRLHDEAARIGLGCALPALEEALASS
jgi:tetratricopeptide (TPR) repeat protein